jgi:hypothetical protein
MESEDKDLITLQEENNTLKIKLADAEELVEKMGCELDELKETKLNE